MKQVGAVVVGVLMSLILLSQVALAGTSVQVGISAPGMYFQASSIHPSPHGAWTGGHFVWNGHRRVWVPGHWERVPVVRTAYVSVQHTHFRDSQYQEGHSAFDSDQHRNDERNDRYDRRDGDGGYSDRNRYDRD